MKVFMTIRAFFGYETLRRQLTDLGVTFREVPFFSGFSGIAFEIKRPRGKGATKVIRKLDELK